MEWISTFLHDKILDVLLELLTVLLEYILLLQFGHVTYSK